MKNLFDVETSVYNDWTNSSALNSHWLNVDTTIPTLIPIQIRIAKYNSKQKTSWRSSKQRKSWFFFETCITGNTNLYFKISRSYSWQNFVVSEKKGPRPLLNFFSSNCDMTEKRLFGRTVIQKLIYKTFFFEHERTWFNQKKDIFYKKAFYYRYKKILWTKIRFSFKFSQHRLTL